MMNLEKLIEVKKQEPSRAATATDKERKPSKVAAAMMSGGRQRKTRTW